MNQKQGDKCGINVWMISAALTLIPFSAAAFDSTSDSPINVEAESVRADNTKGEVTYKGDVIVTQDKSRLEADRVVVYLEDQSLKRIEAFGNPAHYMEPAKGETPATDAEAQTIKYAVSDNQVTLIDDAVIHQAGNIFKGNRIEYNTESRVVTAQGNGDKKSGGRVEMTIQPRNTNSDNASDGAAN